MTFEKALKILNIEDYKERILNSNSKGELIHLADYILIASTFPKGVDFRNWFEQIVKMANEKWERPESVYQHIDKLLESSINQSTPNN